MKIYLAASFSRIEEMRERKQELEAMGHTITSRWIDGGHEAENGISAADPTHVGFALEDLQDIEEATVLIAFTEPPRTRYGRGGRHVEMGFALGIGNIVIVVGHRENIFTVHPDVIFIERFNDVDMALEIAEKQRWALGQRRSESLIKDVQKIRSLEENDDDFGEADYRAKKDNRLGPGQTVRSVAHRMYGR